MTKVAKMTINNNFNRFGMHLILVFFGVLFLFPFLWVFFTSFKGASEAVAVPPSFFPRNWTWDNYPQLFREIPVWRLYFNTIFLVIFRCLAALLFSSMAGYAFARMKFPGRNFWFALVILQFMVPIQVFIFPQYQMLTRLGLLNTLFALIFPGLVSAFGTFLMRQAFMTLPASLEESAILDGCNRGIIFSRIMLPLCKPNLVALAIFTILFAWKSLMWPMIVNTDIDKMTLTAGIMYLQAGVGYIQNYGVMMGGATVIIFPIVVVYLIFQRFFVQGIAVTGIK